MKKILLLTMALGLSLSMLFAQHTKPMNHPNSKNERMEKHDSLWQQLNLTTDQQAQIKQIKANAKSEIDKIKADNNIQPKEKKDKLRAITMKTEKAMHNVLTPEQREKLRLLMQQEMIEKTAKELGLNEDQKNKLTEAQKDFHEKSIQLQEKMKETRKEFTDKVKSFLSEEQFKQYMEKVKRMMEGHRPPIN